MENTATAGLPAPRTFEPEKTLYVFLSFAFVGGFLEAYTFLLHGGVFCNAQTGNLVLFVLRLCEGDFSSAVRYVWSLLAYITGIAASALLPRICRRSAFLIAVTAAETGHLVLATLHTRDAVSALARMVDVFPADKQQQIRMQLADTLQGVIAQQLVPVNNGGRTAAFEVLTVPPAVRSLIRDNKAYQLASYLQGGRQQGMQCMDYALADLARRGVITRQTAEQYAFDHELLNKYLAAK